MTENLRIGIDLGGTKIASVALDHQDNILGERRIATPRNDYEGTIVGIAGLVLAMEQHTGLTGSVGIGIPGSVSPRTRVVQNANSVWLNGRPLQHDLEQRLGRQVRLANDANCFALSESKDGAGRNEHVVFGVILGTGCGGAIVVEGQCLAGTPCDHRRVGAHSPALVRCGRTSRPALLVRAARLYRNVAQRPGDGTRPCR